MGLSNEDGESSNQPSSSSEQSTNKTRKRKISFLDLAKNRMTEASLSIWRNLPGEIRHDPSMINFQREAKRCEGSSSELSVSFKNEFEIDGSKKIEKDSESDSAMGEDQFITIKVTNEDDIVKDESTSDIPVKTRRSPTKSVRIVESPIKTEAAADFYHHNHHSHHLKVESPFQEYGKTFFLIFIWFLIVAFLTSTPEKKIEKRQLVLPINDVKLYNLPTQPHGPLIHITIQAPFLPNSKEYLRKGGNKSHDTRNKDNLINMFLRTDTEKILTANKTFYIYKPEEIDFVNATKIEFTFDIGEENFDELQEDEIVQAVIVSNFSKSNDRQKQEVPITLSVDLMPLNKPIGVLFAAFTLILLYALIVWEVVHRTFAAIIASTLSIGLLAALDDRPTHEEIMAWIDVETILLLFSMMILVGILTETGVFDHIAVYAYRITNGQIWPLIHCLCIITCIISMLLDNVTTVLLMAPITITLCEDMDIDPVPILMAIVIHANIGGCATPIGDPPNIIITTNQTILDQGIHFLNFTVHMLIGTAFITFTTNIHLRFIYPNIRTLFIHEPKDIKILKKNLVTWERALRNSISPFSKDADLVRETLVKKVKALRQELKLKTTRGVIEEQRYKTTLEDMEKAYPIKKKGLLIKSGITLVFILLLFFVQSIPDFRRLSLGWSALIGVIFLLIISNRDDMDAILHRVEWPTLLFFAAMFVLMEAVERMGFISWIGSGTETIIKGVSKDYRLAVAIIIILWVSALTSAFVESLPVTQMMVKIVVSLAGNSKLGLPLQPLVWAIAFGPALGGNGTLVGASANIICAGVAEQHGYKMDFMDFLKFGFPIMLTSVFFSMTYLLFFHSFLSWH